MSVHNAKISQLKFVIIQHYNVSNEVVKCYA